MGVALVAEAALVTEAVEEVEEEAEEALAVDEEALAVEVEVEAEGWWLQGTRRWRWPRWGLPVWGQPGSRWWPGRQERKPVREECDGGAASS